MGSLSLSCFKLASTATAVSVQIDGKTVPSSAVNINQGNISFSPAVTVTQVLTVMLSSGKEQKRGCGANKNKVYVFPTNPNNNPPQSQQSSCVPQPQPSCSVQSSPQCCPPQPRACCPQPRRNACEPKVSVDEDDDFVFLQ